LLPIPIFGLDALARAGRGRSQAANTTDLNVSSGTEVIGKKSNVAAQNHRGSVDVWPGDRTALRRWHDADYRLAARYGVVDIQTEIGTTNPVGYGGS
jgi:hypothetical protein